MSVKSDSESERTDTTISLQTDVRDRLRALKPFESTSYNDLVDDMIDVYEDSERV